MSKAVGFKFRQKLAEELTRTFRELNLVELDEVDLDVVAVRIENVVRESLPSDKELTGVLDTLAAEAIESWSKGASISGTINSKLALAVATLLKERFDCVRDDTAGSGAV